MGLRFGWGRSDDAASEIEASLWERSSDGMP
jgi:hypothetical protein